MNKNLWLRVYRAVAIGVVALIAACPGLAYAGTATSRAHIAEAGQTCIPETPYTHCVRFLVAGPNGGDQIFTVPPTVTEVLANVWGAGGGGSTDGPGGGAGGWSDGVLRVTPGEALTLTVGQGGKRNGLSTYGGGGQAGFSNAPLGTGSGGAAGGGASAISRGPISTSSLIMMAGGGGGGATTSQRGGGGGGGDEAAPGSGGAVSGQHGTQGSGGAAGTPVSGCSPAPTAGSQFSGGRGGHATSFTTPSNGGGGGGGGYFGGGGGTCRVTTVGQEAGSGGGGSGFLHPDVAGGTTNVGQTAAAQGTAALPQGLADPTYQIGIGEGGTNETGGDGMIVLQWQALTITKSVDKPSVQPGDAITYTVTINNDGTGSYPDATLTDDLSDVLDDAIYNNDATASAGTASVAGSILEWKGDAAPGTTTITYSMTVTGQGNGILNNSLVTRNIGTNCTGTAGADCTATAAAAELPKTGAGIISLVIIGAMTIAGGLIVIASARSRSTTR